MLKRLFTIALILMLSASAALADGGILASTAILPACYQYPLEGANCVYADAAVPVYASPSLSGTITGYVNPDQHIHVETINRSAQIAYIYYYQNDTQAGWNFDDSCLKGWIALRYITFYTNAGYLWVVTTDQPGNRLNLRAKPTADSVSLGKYYAGTIAVQLEAPANGYMKVQIGHMAGYMDTRFLTKGLYTPTAELPLLTVVRQSGAQLHKMPDSDSEMIKDVPCGATVCVLAVRDDAWVQVMYEGEIGYAVNSAMTPELEY